MLEKVWRKNRRLLFSVAGSVLLDQSILEDVLQDAFTRILAAKRNFSNEDEALQFMTKIVMNTAIDHYRYIRRRTRSAWVASARAAAVYHLTDEFQDPLNLVIREERRHRRKSLLVEIEKIRDSLPPEQQQALELVFQKKSKGGLKKVCDDRGLPYSTVRSRMLAALDSIRFQLSLKGLWRESDEEEIL